jgi:hypothetical protein
MKKSIYSINSCAFILSFFVMSTFFVSCSNELDINQDPDNPVKVPLGTILSSAEVNLAYTLGGEATRMPASIVQHYAGHRGQPLDYAQFNITPSATDGLWTNLYDILQDLKTIENDGKNTNDKLFIGISQILQGYTFSVATDIFGDLPFTQSLQGAAIINPSYDKQEFVYTSLINLIDLGIVNIKSKIGTNPGTADVVFNGNLVKWEKFANSLKLRLFNHLSKKSPQAAINFLQTNPLLIDSSVDDAKVVFGNSASNANPIHQFDVLSGRKDNAVCATIVNKMTSLNDPRIGLYFNKVLNNGQGNEGKYIGNKPGDDTDDAGENLYSRVGSAFASIDSPVLLMSAAEVNFIKSEIYFRSSDLPNSKSSYEKAIKEDFIALGASDVDVYMANPLVVFDNSLARIMEQKWITMFQASYESWVDWRRTGFPVLVFPEINRTNNVIPRRLPYPQIEINVNGASLSSGPGIPVPFETIKKGVWWDN